MPHSQPPLQSPSPQARVQNTRTPVRALYTHNAVSDTQLSFCEGEIITAIGEKREGWQYGENMKTGRYDETSKHEDL